MKKGKVVVLTFVLLLALAVPTAAMAMENGNGGSGTGHSVNLLTLGNWHYVNADGSIRPMPRIALTDGMVLKSGDRIAFYI